jgi:hypothetical protein
VTKFPSALFRLTVLGLAWVSGTGAQAVPAEPFDPVEAILQAFDNHEVVALGEGNHGSLPSHELRMKLIRDPRFHGEIRDIVVEFGNSLHQDVIDRFVRGEDVAPEDLKRVWQDTAQANPVWELPIYEAFYRAVREVNSGLPDDKKLRIVAGDVPFDWSGVRTLQDYRNQPQRDDAVSAGILRREVLDKGRKALLIFGDFHLLRKPLMLVPRDGSGEHAHEATRERSIVAHLESAGVEVFTIYGNTFLDLATLQPDTGQWPVPAIALLADTPLGTPSFETYQSPPTMVDGEWFEVDSVHSPAMEEEFDAILHLGAPSAIKYSAPPSELCRDDAYLEMRFFRMNLVGWGAEVEQIKRFCAAVTGTASTD